MRTAALLTILFCAVALALAIGATTDDAIPDHKYLEYAKGFAPYTVRVTATGSNGKPHVGTATLIGHHHAITAAHIVDGATKVEISGRAASRVDVHPKFDDKCVGCFDVAVLRFDQSFGLDYYPPLSTGDEKAGDVCSVAGYGVHGRMSLGYDSADDRLRAGTCRIERFDGTRIICPISRGSSPLPYGIAPGDSGGPLFANGRLCGVNSFTMADKGPLKSREGEEQGFARVSEVREWIEGVMR